MPLVVVQYKVERRCVMHKYVYLWGGTAVGIVGPVSRVHEQSVDSESQLKRGVRDAWEQEHPGKFLQLVVSENHPDMR